MTEKDNTIENLLDLNGIRFVIDEQHGLWVKFEVRKVAPTHERPHGMRYSLSLHDADNKRILGFDNAHAIEYGKKKYVKAKRTYYHWHRNKQDSGSPYEYISAEKLLVDFWEAVDKAVKQYQEVKR